jgi:hypothetical protein
MKNPFKKYGHIKTRYDEMKARDFMWKLEEGIRSPQVWLKYQYRENPMYICGCGR